MISKWAIFALIAILPFHSANAREIKVKYRADPVDVDNGHFQVIETKPSTLVQQIIYDSPNNYLLVDLNGTFYHYCGIPGSVVSAWVASPSLGSFYNSAVKGNYDCRTYPVPHYDR